jgi:RHS repeat-associated core domain protein
VYDVLDHAMKVTLPDNSTTQTEYSTDAGSNTLKTLVTDALGNRQAPIPTATLQSREYALI